MTEDRPTDPTPSQRPELVVPITGSTPPPPPPPPPTSTGPTDTAAGVPAGPPAGAVVHEVQVSQGHDARPGSLLARIGVVVVVVALLGAGVVAVQGFGSSGGSNTPEGAVQELFDALGNEDFLGAAELVEPAERRTLVDPAIDMVNELRRLRVLADEFDLGSVAGIDLEFTDLAYSPEPLGAGVTRVQVDGSVTTSGDVTELDLGSLVLDNVPARELQLMQDEAATASTEALDAVGVVAVERNGRWYVSLWYSVAEAARRSAGAPLPQFGAGPTPVGGATPEESVQNLAAAAAGLDLGGVIAQLDPEETAALYDYSTLFLDDVDAAAAELRAEDPSFSVTVDRLDLRSEVSGDDAVVWIDGVALSVAGVEGGVAIDTAADCLVFTVDEWNPDGRCEIDQADLTGANEWGLDLALDDLPAPSVRAHRVGDRWYLAPTASVLQPALEMMRVVEPDQLQRWVDDPDVLFDDLPDVMAAAPESAGLAVAGLGGIVTLGQVAEQQFMEVDQAFDDDFGDTSSFELVEPGVLDPAAPPLIELEERPVDPQVPPQIELERPAVITVLVAASDIPAGAVIGPEDVIEVPVPAEVVDGDTVIDPDLIVGLTALEDIPTSQVLRFSMFLGS